MVDLGLQYQSEKHFGFLLSDKSFRCIESTPCRVRFESAKVFVEVVFDGESSYELQLLIGRIGSESPPFSLDEILRFCRAIEAESFSLVQVTTSETLAIWVEKLATAFRTYGSDFIAGKESCFSEVAALRGKEVQNYALERELRAARREAETAWHKKDYMAVIRALAPVRTSLTATELAKLEFAERQCAPK